MKKLLLATALALVPFGAGAADDITVLVAKWIRAYGFDCPGFKGSEHHGKDHRGTVFKVWCGQVDGRGNPIYFRVVEDANNIPGMNFPDIRVYPWLD